MPPTPAKRPLLRLDQALSRFGYCSRSEAKYWVKAGRVSIAGMVATQETARVDPAKLTVDGAPVDFPDGLLIMLHKPAGLVCAHDAPPEVNVYRLLPDHLMARNPTPATIGRLDKETSGLIFITDDGDLIHRWTSPKHEMEKEYEATLDADLPAHAAQVFASGELMLKDEGKKDHLKPCKSAKLEVLEPRKAHVTLTEGRYHQVRRMFAALGCTVLTLHRLRMGEHTLEGLEAGQWRAVEMPAR